MQDKIFGMVSELMETPLDEVSLDSSSQTLVGWNSLNHLTLVLRLEEEFGVTFNDDQLIGMTDVKTIVSTLEDILANK